MIRRRWNLPMLLLAVGALVLGQMAVGSHDHGHDREGSDGRGADRVVGPSAPCADADGAAESAHSCPLCVLATGCVAWLPETCCWAAASPRVGPVGAGVPEGASGADALGAMSPRAPPYTLV
ncbi:hypothetical protein HQ560_00675 [bacterium]|nr:hypothetical protein [bacterium]